MPNKNKNDKKKNGRKYTLALIVLALLLGGFGLAGVNDAYAALYPEFIGAMLGVLFVYCSGNAAHAWAIGKKDGFQVSMGGQPPAAPPAEHPPVG